MSYNQDIKSISCRFKNECGGCDMTDIAYEEELSLKKKYVEGLFKGICKVDSVHGMYRPIYYRNKVHACLGQNDAGQIISGIYAKGSHRIVPVDSCMIEDQECDRIIFFIRDYLNKHKATAYDEDKKKGQYRHILVRKAFSTGDIQVILVLADPVLKGKKALIEALVKEFPAIKSIVVNINNQATSMVLSDTSKTIYGSDVIVDALLKKKFRIGPDTFYQINHDQAEKLYKKAYELADLKKTDVLVDAYCGVGTIGLCAANLVDRVIGVELNPNSVREAKLNAKLNGIKNASFYAADAGDFLLDYVSQSKKMDVLIMDPPRSGSTEKFLDCIVKSGLKRLVYISCDPSTQARDLKYLLKRGYKMASLCYPYDMFPHTNAVETVILMRNRNIKPDGYIKLEVNTEELDAAKSGISDTSSEDF